MKRFALFACLLLCGCELQIDDGSDGCPDGQCPRPAPYSPHGTETPAMNLPENLRQVNYGGGSCVHASTESTLIWQDMIDKAAYWRKTYGGGESIQGLVAKMEHENLRYAYTSSGDVNFLDWCDRTRRGAVIFYFPNHSICFAGWDHANGDALLLDNNRVHSYIRVPHDEFVRAWKGYGGVALTPVYSPTPPIMWVAG